METATATLHRMCDPGIDRILTVKTMIGIQRIIPLCCLLLPMMARAQVATLRVLVVDSVSGAGLVGAGIAEGNDRPLCITDKYGACIVRSNAPVPEVIVSHLGYSDRRIAVPMGATAITVHMVPTALELPIAEIHAPTPEVVMKDDHLDVAEFEITDEGIWVLAYGKPRMLRSQENAGKSIYQDVTLFLLDTAWQRIASVPIVGDVLALHRDFRGVVYVEAPAMAYACQRSGRSILLEKVERKTLREAILPWTDSIPGWLLGNNDDRSFYSFDHFAFDPRSEKSRVFCTVEDPFTRELFRSQYKYMSGHDKVVAMDLALRSGIDKQVIAGYMTGFQHHLYFHPPYAPLFVVNDTIRVFDHACGSIRAFTSELLPCVETPIDFHRRNLWNGRLVQDEATEAVYVVEEKNASTAVERIDMPSGSTGAAFTLHNRYPEEVMVYDGYVYYTYRPFGGEQTRWLYRERMR